MRLSQDLADAAQQLTTAQQPDELRRRIGWLCAREALAQRPAEELPKDGSDSDD
jgi:hypothetical protein